MTKLALISIVAGLAALIEAVQLTNEDYTLTPGEPFTISWSEAEGPVTLTLKNGPPEALVTVQEITSGQTGESFVWNVPTTFASGQYAFEIKDATGVPNYSPQFALAGDGTQSAPPATGSVAPATSASAESLSQPSEPSSIHHSTTEAVNTETSSHASVETESSIESFISHHHSSNETHHATTLTGRPTTTRSVETETEEPSATETEGGETTVPGSGAAGRSGALFGLLAAFALVA